MLPLLPDVITINPKDVIYDYKIHTPRYVFPNEENGLTKVTPENILTHNDVFRLVKMINQDIHTCPEVLRYPDSDEYIMLNKKVMNTISALQPEEINGMIKYIEELIEKVHLLSPDFSIADHRNHEDFNIDWMNDLCYLGPRDVDVNMRLEIIAKQIKHWQTLYDELSAKKTDYAYTIGIVRASMSLLLSCCYTYKSRKSQLLMTPLHLSQNNQLTFNQQPFIPTATPMATSATPMPTIMDV